MAQQELWPQCVVALCNSALEATTTQAAARSAAQPH